MSTAKQPKQPSWIRSSSLHQPPPKSASRKIVDASSGFLYLVSRFGVTGAQTAVADTTVRADQEGAAIYRRKSAFGGWLWHLQTRTCQTRHQCRRRCSHRRISAFINIIEQNKNDMLSVLQTTAQALKTATKNKTA